MIKKLKQSITSSMLAVMLLMAGIVFATQQARADDVNLPQCTHCQWIGQQYIAAMNSGNLPLAYAFAIEWAIFCGDQGDISWYSPMMLCWDWSGSYF